MNIVGNTEVTYQPHRCQPRNFLQKDKKNDFDTKIRAFLSKILLGACESVSVTVCFIVIHGTGLCFS